jgi:hypothetical protein
VQLMDKPPPSVKQGPRRLWLLAMRTARRPMSQITSGQHGSMKGVRYYEDIRVAAGFAYLAGEYWTNAFYEAWGAPRRCITARSFNRFTRERGLAPLRDGTTFVGTPAVLDFILCVLMTTGEACDSPV